jgi:hypothetical protein
MKKCRNCKIEQSYDNFPKRSASSDGYALYCRNCKKQADRQHYLKNRDKINKQNLKNYTQNKSRYKKQSLKSYHRLKENKQHINYWRNILRNTLEKLNQQKTQSTKTSLGYSALELKQHLDNLGMDWKADSIDHKIPITWFIPITPPSIVNDLRNLQPMLLVENITKSNRRADIVDNEYLQEVLPFIKKQYIKYLVF